MCVLAHPDDESLGMGGTLAKYSREGIATFLVTATRGERGRFGDNPAPADPAVVGATREAELRAAAKELGVGDVALLGYPDGALDRVDPTDAVETIAGHLRRVRPHVVISFGPEGAYGHPDHIAISQFTTAAIVCAADPRFGSAARGASADVHRVSKFYYMAWSEEKWAAYQNAFRTLTTTVDGVVRRVNPWPAWALTTSVDASDAWPAVWRAISCHETQMSIYRKLEALSEADHRMLWGTQEFYRVFSLVNGGRTRESDVFEGLR